MEMEEAGEGRGARGLRRFLSPWCCSLGLLRPVCVGCGQRVAGMMSWRRRSRAEAVVGLGGVGWVGVEEGVGVGGRGRVLLGTR